MVFICFIFKNKKQKPNCSNIICHVTNYFVSFFLKKKYFNNKRGYITKGAYWDAPSITLFKNLFCFLTLDKN